MGERIHSIDSLRAVAISFVVIAHTHPFHAFGPYGSEIYFILDTIGQFDVPFFFVAAGYFLAERARPGELKSLLLDSTRKLGSMYLFGTLLFVSVLSVLTVGAATATAGVPRTRS